MIEDVLVDIWWCILITKQENGKCDVDVEQDSSLVCIKGACKEEVICILNHSAYTHRIINDIFWRGDVLLKNYNAF